MNSFFKRYEIYSPDDLCWLEVWFECKTKEITIRDRKRGGTPIEICDGSAHQLQQMTAILRHLESKEFPYEDGIPAQPEPGGD